MTLKTYLPKSLLMVAVGAAMGYVAASSPLERSTNAASSEKTASTAAVADTKAESESSCSDGLTRSDQIALASHNQLVAASLAQTGKKPNIIVLWGDDIGVHNISAYNHGIMGYRTPNIDRIAKEGALFTDSYSQQSCTAGRASFILGQHPFRTGLLTIGMPGSTHGIPEWTPTIGDLLKEQGYTTGQFGKNHLGDRDNHLPTLHGFDEFFGNLYHLNAEEEPETY